jgi:mono/diheme cytochrome c family protein
MDRIPVWYLSLVAALALFAAAGCQKGAESGGAAGGDTALLEKGKAVYAANNCANCHSLNGAGGRGGPDLTKVGAEEGHTAEKLAEYVKQPAAGSRMPAFAGKISDDDLKALGVYLASLK